VRCLTLAVHFAETETHILVYTKELLLGFHVFPQCMYIVNLTCICVYFLRFIFVLHPYALQLIYLPLHLAHQLHRIHITSLQIVDPPLKILNSLLVPALSITISILRTVGCFEGRLKSPFCFPRSFSSSSLLFSSPSSSIGAWMQRAIFEGTWVCGA
jgi:hypothetical protein